MTWSRIVGVGALAVMLGPVARAEGAAKDAKDTGKIEDPARTGRPRGSERPGEVGGTAVGSRELSGTFVKADATTVYLEHMGAIVPLKIDEGTKFSGQGVKSGRDLAEGQEVRASFTVKGTDNVADRIAVASASGRSGETRTGGTASGQPESKPPAPRDGGRGMPGDTPVPRDPGRPGPVDPGVPPVPKY